MFTAFVCGGASLAPVAQTMAQAGCVMAGTAAITAAPANLP